MMSDVANVLSYQLCGDIYIERRLKIIFYKNFTYWRRQNIPCDSPNWIVGNLKGISITNSFRQIWQEYYDKYKDSGCPFVGFYWFTRPGVFVLDPILIKQILIKDFSKFSDRGIMYCNEEDDPLTGSLFNLSGAKWRYMRNKISPAFTVCKIKAMFPLFKREAEELVKLFKETPSLDPILEVRDLISRYTADVIGSCAFGMEINSLQQPNTEFLKMCRRALVEQRMGIVIRFSYPDIARRLHVKHTLGDVEEYFIDIIRNTLQCREQSGVRRNDFIDILLDLKNNNLGEDAQNLSFGQIAAQIFSFLLAGYESSSTAMAFALYELAQNPTEQEKARQEVIEVIERHDQLFSYECLKDLVYLEQIMKETLRLYPIAYVLTRQTLEDYTITDLPNFCIKKGTPIFLPAGAIQRDERYFSQPNIFKPDNFSAENVKARHFCLNLSFGQGPRNCIGLRFAKMQTLIGLTLLLSNFKFSICNQTPIPLIYKKRNFMNYPEKKIFLKVEKIE
ncbi:probable cytochrome P450 6a21 [Musca autumnalis]|uniref:probable cytochrome P450 6a21 n=1 Tax=Musca autumnalis TaxID=221902 RepID=UPI003CF38A12